MRSQKVRLGHKTRGMWASAFSTKFLLSHPPAPSPRLASHYLPETAQAPASELSLHVKG